jgi:tRNA A-37 threonylcarbamoyl transferase component Bud32
MDRFLVITGGLPKDGAGPVSTIGCFDTQVMNWVPIHPSSVISTLPVPLYGHCSVAHGQRNLWLIGGISSNGMAVKSITHFTFEFLVDLNPSPATPPTIPIGAESNAKHCSTICAEAAPHETHVGFKIVGIKTFPLQFPVVFASCVKLSGHPNYPMALVMCGLSTVREIECGSRVVKVDGADPLNPDETEVRRLGLTDRCFALNLDTFSILRVGQQGESPPPRAFASVSTVGEVTSSVDRALVPESTQLILFGGKLHPSNVSLSGGDPVAQDVPRSQSEKRLAWARRAQVHDAAAVYIGRVEFEQNMTISIAWKKFTRRSAAELWPLPTMGHQLLPLSGYHLLVGGRPATNQENEESPATPLTGRARVYVLQYRAQTGVAWTELKESDLLPGRTDDTSAQPTLCGRVFFSAARKAEGTVLVVGGGEKSDHVVTAAPLKLERKVVLPDDSEQLLKVWLELPSLNKQQRILVSGGAKTWPPVPQQVMLDEQFQSGSTAPKLALTTAPTWAANSTPFRDDSPALAITIDTSMINLDRLTSLIAREIVERRIGDLQPKYSNAEFVENNLLLYKWSEAGDRIPLNNDYVLKQALSTSMGNDVSIVASLDPQIERYSIRGKIGSGSYGTVFAVICLDTTTVYAMKEVECHTDEQRMKLMREIRLMRGLRHPNIVQYKGVEMQKNNRARIFMEMVNNAGLGTLHDYASTVMPIRLVQMYVRQVLAAVAYLHSFNIAHQDIKGANVLVGVDGVKLADFGTAQQLKPGTDVTAKTVVGTPLFLAPELLLESSTPTLASDIWAIGCLVIEVSSSKYPWEEVTKGRATTEDKMLALFDALKRGLAPQYPERPDFPLSGAGFLDLCFLRDPKQRPTARELIEHPFLTDLVDDCGRGGEATLWESADSIALHFGKGGLVEPQPRQALGLLLPQHALRKKP